MVSQECWSVLAWVAFAWIPFDASDSFPALLNKYRKNTWRQWHCYKWLFCCGTLHFVLCKPSKHVVWKSLMNEYPLDRINDLLSLLTFTSMNSYSNTQVLASFCVRSTSAWCLINCFNSYIKSYTYIAYR